MSLSIVDSLKQESEDFEFYPTTFDMVKPIYDFISNGSYNDRIHSVLDIGCGSCAFYKHYKTLEDHRASQDSDRPCYPQYYVMEKSNIHLSLLPKEAIVLGTDFNLNSLLDKPVDAVFCNPPYSQFETWVTRILKESLAKHIFLIIPQRWTTSDIIQSALTSLGSNISHHVMASFDFHDAPRSARAKVDLIHFTRATGYKSFSAFNSWFDATFPETKPDSKSSDTFSASEDRLRQAMSKVDSSRIQHLVDLYTQDLDQLRHHFETLMSLDPDILSSVGVSRKNVAESLKLKASGLKNLYWSHVFSSLDEITLRLTSASREALLNQFTLVKTVDFTADNVYQVVVWICKNASSFYDEQLVNLYKTFTSEANIIKYKSNQKAFIKDTWGRFLKDRNTHYVLSNRIVCDSLYFKPNRYSYIMSKTDPDKAPEIDPSSSQTIIQDLRAVAHNLGFITEEPEISEVYAKKYYLWLKTNDGNKEPLIEYKLHKNGNHHLKLHPEFVKAMNVEVSRLLGWIRKPQDIRDEFPEEMAKDAEKYFHSNASTLLNQGLNQSIPLSISFLK